MKKEEERETKAEDRQEEEDDKALAYMTMEVDQCNICRFAATLKPEKLQCCSLQLQSFLTEFPGLRSSWFIQAFS